MIEYVKGELTEITPASAVFGPTPDTVISNRNNALSSRSAKP